MNKSNAEIFIVRWLLFFKKKKRKLYEKEQLINSNSHKNKKKSTNVLRGMSSFAKKKKRSVYLEYLKVTHSKVFCNNLIRYIFRFFNKKEKKKRTYIFKG